MVLKRFVKGFAYAFAGISYAFRSQVNMRFHVFTAIAVIVSSVVFRINALEWCIVLFCISSVFAAELINTSIEVHVDVTTPERNEKAGHVKDLAAAAVLVVCIVSTIIGLIIFIPKIFS